MSFREQTSAFFDEMTRIIDEQKKARDEYQGIREGTPYSSMLTQDEEPVVQYNPAELELEPEVVTRR